MFSLNTVTTLERVAKPYGWRTVLWFIHVPPELWECHSDPDLDTFASSPSFSNSVHFSRSVVSNSLRPHESQRSRHYFANRGPSGQGYGMDVRVGLWRKLSTKKLMLLNCGVGEDSWESLGLQGDSSPSWRRSVLGVHWKDWCWSWNSQYFGHLMRRVDSLEKTLMLGGIRGRRRRGWQRMRWLDGISDSMGMSFQLWSYSFRLQMLLNICKRLKNTHIITFSPVSGLEAISWTQFSFLGQFGVLLKLLLYSSDSPYKIRLIVNNKIHPNKLTLL